MEPIGDADGGAARLVALHGSSAIERRRRWLYFAVGAVIFGSLGWAAAKEDSRRELEALRGRLRQIYEQWHYQWRER